METAVLYFLLVGVPIMIIWGVLFVVMTRRKKRFREMTPEQAEHMPAEGVRYADLDPDRVAIGDTDEDYDNPDAVKPSNA